MRHRTTAGRRLAASLLLCALAGAAIAPAIGATATSVQFAQAGEETRIAVQSATVAPGETAAVEIVLTSAPAGLSGYNATVQLSGTEAVRIAGADYPDTVGLTSEPTVGDDGRTVDVEAADVNKRIEPGAADVTLAMIEVEARSTGSATVSVGEVEADGDDGERLSPTATSGSVTAAEPTPTAAATDAQTTAAGGSTDTDAPNGAADGSTDTDGSPAGADPGGVQTGTDATGADGSGFGVVAALAALLAGSGLVRRRG